MGGTKFIPCNFSRDDVRQHEHLGAKRKSNLLCKAGIDLKPNRLFVNLEMDNPSEAREPVHISDRQDGPLNQDFENGREALLFGFGDEQDMAFLGVARVPKACRDDVPSPDLVADKGIEIGAEGILAEDANPDGRVRIGKNILGPLREPREVVQHDRFHEILRKGLGFGSQRRLARCMQIGARERDREETSAERETKPMKCSAQNPSHGSKSSCSAEGLSDFPINESDLENINKH